MRASASACWSMSTYSLRSRVLVAVAVGVAVAVCVGVGVIVAVCVAVGVCATVGVCVTVDVSVVVGSRRLLPPGPPASTCWWQCP